LDEETKGKYLQTIQNATERLNNLIGNVLKLNKLEHQELKEQLQTFDLTEALAQTVLAFEDSMERKHLQIQCQFENVQIYSAPSLLEIVWSNLLSNAIKFTEEGGEIFVSLRRVEDTAEIRVRDSGCGISPEVGSRIFEKFYQGDTSHFSEGNGLGLALVKKVIDILGGKISVESELGKGSTFTVVLYGAESR
jgi:signal transduction histidine kinase